MRECLGFRLLGPRFRLWGFKFMDFGFKFRGLGFGVERLEFMGCWKLGLGGEFRHGS